MDGGIKCSNNVLITYAPHRKFSEEMFGGFRNSSYLCPEKKCSIKYIDNIRPPESCCERSEQQPLFTGRRPRGLRNETPYLWRVVGGAADRGLGRELPSGGVGAKPPSFGIQGKTP